MENLKLICRMALCLIFITTALRAQEVENEVQTRTDLELVFKPIKNLKLSFLPQLRFDEELSLSKYLFETEVEYDLLSFLELGANYRYEVNPRDEKDTEYFNRYAFNITAKKEFGRIEPAFRLRFSNYADDDVNDKTFMRYKASVKYDIQKCRFTPLVAIEAFQELNNNSLYKMRYTLGGDYKIFKNNYLSVKYKFDYYQKEYLNKHIIDLGYKIKF